MFVFDGIRLFVCGLFARLYCFFSWLFGCVCCNSVDLCVSMIVVLFRLDWLLVICLLLFIVVYGVADFICLIGIAVFAGMTVWVFMASLFYLFSGCCLLISYGGF